MAVNAEQARAKNDAVASDHEAMFKLNSPLEENEEWIFTTLLVATNQAIPLMILSKKCV